MQDLRDEGYDVIFIRYNKILTNPRDFPSHNSLDLVVGHSAGGSIAIALYGGTDVKVIALNSPFGSRHNNVVTSSNIGDPVTWIGGVLPTYYEGGSLSDRHSKNRAWSRVDRKHWAINDLVHAHSSVNNYPLSGDSTPILGVPVYGKYI